MPDMNPYQAPNSDPGADRFARKVAGRFLEIRERGPSYPIFLREHLPWMMLRCVPTLLVFFIISRYGEESAFPAMGGLVGYTIYLEFLYPRVVARVWVVYEKIIDWEKVRKLAE
jgi:hypothetical protein